MIDTTGKTFLRWMLGLSLAWTTSLALAPMLLAPGTVHGLDGRANFIDYPQLWATLPLYERVVYTIGDLNCHQMEHRSWFIHGNQMPVDARMTAGFLFGNLGFALALRAPSMLRFRDEIAQILPARQRAILDSPLRRLLAVWGTAVIAVGPAALDVALQLFTDYESTNVLRAVTGAWLGVLGGVWIGVLFDSLLADGPARPRDADVPSVAST